LKHRVERRRGEQWISSITYNLNRPRLGAYTEFSRSWRISVGPWCWCRIDFPQVDEAARVDFTQAEHFPQGLEVTPVRN